MNNILLFGADDEIAVKLTDYSGFPGNNTDHKLFRMSNESSLIQPPEYLNYRNFDQKGDSW